MRQILEWWEYNKIILKTGDGTETPDGVEYIIGMTTLIQKNSYPVKYYIFVWVIAQGGLIVPKDLKKANPNNKEIKIVE